MHNLCSKQNVNLCSTSLSSSSSLHCHWGDHCIGQLRGVLEGRTWRNSYRRCWHSYNKLVRVVTLLYWCLLNSKLICRIILLYPLHIQLLAVFWIWKQRNLDICCTNAGYCVGKHFYVNSFFVATHGDNSIIL